jgi:hypothetical protein
VSRKQLIPVPGDFQRFVSSLTVPNANTFSMLMIAENGGNLKRT